MAGEHDNLVQKDMCDIEHKIVHEKLVDLKANIHTAKESLGNHLDEVDAEVHKALLGNVDSPGGLLADVDDLKTNMKTAKIDWDEHKKIINDKIDTQNFKMKICLILVGILIGGKILGYSITSIVDYMKPPIKSAPVVVPKPTIEEDNNVLPE